MVVDIKDLKNLDDLQRAVELKVIDLSVPLAEQPVDHFNKIATKTDIYLDLSHFNTLNAPSVFGALLGIIAFICLTILIFCFPNRPQIQQIFLYCLNGCVLLIGLCFIGAIFFAPSGPFMRLHRQRREVYVTNDWFHSYVPWDQIIVVRAYCREGKGNNPNKHVARLFFYIKNPTDAGYQKLTELVCGRVKDNAEQKINEFLECLRLFMDCSPDASPNSVNNCTTPEDGLDISASFYNWRKYKKFPTFSKPDILEWSKPIFTPTTRRIQTKQTESK